MLPLKQLRICSSPGSSISDHPSCYSGIDSADQRNLHLPLSLDCFSEEERIVRGISNSRVPKTRTTVSQFHSSNMLGICTSEIH